MLDHTIHTLIVLMLCRKLKIAKLPLPAKLIYFTFSHQYCTFWSASQGFHGISSMFME